MMTVLPALGTEVMIIQLQTNTGQYVIYLEDSGLTLKSRGLVTI